VDVGILAARRHLVRVGELVDGKLVLVRMTRPGPIHQAVRLILLVLLEDLQRPLVQRRVGPARIEGRHAADGEHAALVADLRHHLAQGLEKGDIVGNGVAVRQDPTGARAA